MPGLTQADLDAIAEDISRQSTALPAPSSASVADLATLLTQVKIRKARQAAEAAGER